MATSLVSFFPLSIHRRIPNRCFYYHNLIPRLALFIFIAHYFPLCTWYRTRGRRPPSDSHRKTLSTPTTITNIIIITPPSLITYHIIDRTQFGAQITSISGCLATNCYPIWVKVYRTKAERWSRLRDDGASHGTWPIGFSSQATLPDATRIFSRRATTTHTHATQHSTQPTTRA